MALPQANQELIRRHVKGLLIALGEDPDREGLKGTPDRVARLYDDILDSRFGSKPQITVFEEEKYHGIIMVHHAPFYAFCEHHLLPFLGHFAVGYVPDTTTIGLSKLVRIFRFYSKRVTIQERLTEQAVDAVMTLVKPHGAIVYVSAEHTCMSLRGVKSP